MQLIALRTILRVSTFLSVLAAIRGCMTVCRKGAHPTPSLPTPPTPTPSRIPHQFPRVCYKCRLNWASTFKYCQKDQMNYVACSDAEVESTHRALSHYEQTHHMDLGVTKIRSNFACIYGYLPQEIMFQDWYLENKLGDHREFQFVYKNYSWKGTGINGCVYDTFKMQNSFIELAPNYTHKIAMERENRCKENCKIRFKEPTWEYAENHLRHITKKKSDREYYRDKEIKARTVQICQDVCKRPSTDNYANETFTEIGTCNKSYCNNVSPFKTYKWDPASHKKRTYLGCIQLDKNYKKLVFIKEDLNKYDRYQGVFKWNWWWRIYFTRHNKPGYNTVRRPSYRDYYDESRIIPNNDRDNECIYWHNKMFPKTYKWDTEQWSNYDKCRRENVVAKKYPE